MARIARFLRSSGLSLGLILLPIAAEASSIAIDQALYGHLDQALVTTCTSDTGINNACGATSVVNSFVYLQNRYPSIYGNLLIPQLPGNTAQQNQIAAAETLTCYQGCVGNTGGTAIADFITGKINYIDSVAPGTTTFAVQNYFDAQNSVFPTFNFLYNELLHGEDVELLIGWYVTGPNGLVRNGGHYVTLTGINSPNNDGNGTINFIDPNGGTNFNNIATFLVGNEIRTTAYKPDGATVGIIEAAVAESPIPEPTTFILVLGGLPLLLRLRRMKRSS